MATKRKTTSTKRAASTAKKTTTSKKTTVKKVVAKKIVTKPTKTTKIANIQPATKVKEQVKKPTSVLAGLRKLNMLAGLALFAQAVALPLVSAKKTLPINVSYTTTNSLAANGADTLAPASRNLFDLKIAVFIAAVLGLSAVLHLLISSFWRAKYEAGVEKGTNKLRWAECGVLGGLMTALVAMVAGVSDASSIWAIFVLILLAAAGQLFMERDFKQGQKVSWRWFVVSLVAGISAWKIIVVHVFASNRYGEVSPSKWVWGVLASAAVFSLAAVLVNWKHYRGKTKWTNYLKVEKTSIVLGLVGRSLVAWLIYAALLKK